MSDLSPIGRGASIGRLLSSRDRLAGFRGCRAVVEASLIRLAGKTGQVSRAHMRFIQRDGVTPEGLANHSREAQAAKIAIVALRLAGSGEPAPNTRCNGKPLRNRQSVRT